MMSSYSVAGNRRALGSLYCTPSGYVKIVPVNIHRVEHNSAASAHAVGSLTRISVMNVADLISMSGFLFADHGFGNQRR
jgi:hypothetical protein